MTSKQKKPPSKSKTLDLIQTIFGRLTERKVCFLYMNFGEDDRTLIMGTMDENELVFGNPEFSLLAIRLKDDDLFYETESYFKDFGVRLTKDRRRPVVFNYRLASAMMNKYDSSAEYPVEWDKENGECFVWKEKKVKNGKREEWMTVKEFITERIHSFFKFNQIYFHTNLCIDLLDKKRPDTCYVPWGEEMTVRNKSFEITNKQLDYASDCNPTFFPINGILTFGKDILNISALKKQKYNIDASHICVVKDGEGAERIAHRVDTPAVTAVLLRPYKIFFKGKE